MGIEETVGDAMMRPRERRNLRMETGTCMSERSPRSPRPCSCSSMQTSWLLVLGAVVLCAFGAAARAEAADRYALIVSGAAGSKEVAEQQLRWRATLAKALRDKTQIPGGHLLVLSDQPVDANAEGGSG